jgi:hypothetical protein
MTTHTRASYVAPQVRTLRASEVVEALGPVSAGSGLTSSGSDDGCDFWAWLFHQC